MGSGTLFRRATWALLFPFMAAACAHAEEKNPWARVVIIGASVSHGFTASEPFGGPKTAELALDRYLDAALLPPHEPLRNLANATFFMLPDDMGHTEIRQALTNHPTLVVGIDFLFWYCYGGGQTERDRLDHFEKGLQLLESFDCPLIVGDIPDASAAVNRMLSLREMPTPQTRSAANRRLKQWAAQHKQVTVVPIAQFMREATANKAISIHGWDVAAGTTRELLQGDRLHPSPRGCAMLAISILDAFAGTHPELDASQVRWDPEAILQTVKSMPVEAAKPAQSGPGLKP
jgi:hypothetical protein